jgi:uncharacterized repeat protein (TIGR01451 family)
VPAGLNDVVAIAAGLGHSLALKRDGTVVVWGDSRLGQLRVPAGLNDVVAIAAGGFHSLALKRDGTVVAWGGNAVGQLDVPAGLSNVTAIAAGLTHSLALVSDTTTPGISARITGTRGDGGWYTGNVSVSWNVTDGESSVDALEGCDAATISSDTAGAQLTCTASSTGGAISAAVTIKRDATPPQTTSRVSTSASQATITLDADDALSGLASTSYSIDGGALQTYSGPFTLSGAGSYTISYFSTDRAGNIESTQTLPVTIVADTERPGVTLSSSAPDPTNSAPILVTAQFSENVSGFTADDITLGNATIGNFVALDGDTYTFELTPSDQGLVTASTAAGVAQDAAGNTNTAAVQLSRTFDSSAPSVTIEQAAGQPDPASSGPISFTVHFSEPVSGFSDADVNLGGTAGATTAVVSQSAPNDGTTYTVAVSGMTTSGTVIASVPTNAVLDAAGNPNSASTSADNSVAFLAPAADLTLAVRHSGDFTQGQAGAQYTITVTNTGAAPTSGTVQVVDTLPAGLTATALSGSGWSCTLATLTCTRDDVLAASSSYPDITLTVDVAANAPASLTNQASVSGGGEQDTADNSASDPTSITPDTGGVASGAHLVADPCLPGKQALLVIGTAGNDTIRLASTSTTGQARVVINGAEAGTFTPSGLIIVQGLAGNDTIAVDKKLPQARILYGDDGNDTLDGDVGRNILVGGAGDDTFEGDDGRDILLGGAGADTLKGNDGEDILLAGSSSYDQASPANQAALCAIQAEWLRTDLAYAARVAHLSGATGGGQNGPNLLKPGQTVFDDSSKDKLKSDDDQDWLLLNQRGGSALDTHDRKGSEVATEL